jgi:predicted HicB family RNase H-like nuclease
VANLFDTYNTETATRLPQSIWDDDKNDEVTGVLYQTRGGAFFLAKFVTKQVWIEALGETQTRERNEVIPMSAKEAQQWMMEGEVEVYANPFEDPPEATAEPEQGATIYIRVPASLKQRVDKAATSAKVSGNAWAMKCVERCLEEKDISDFRELAAIHHIAAGLRSAWSADQIGEDVGLDKWKLGKATEALDTIADYANSLAVRLLDDERAFDDWGAIFMGDPEFDEINKTFQPYPDDRASRS